MATGYEVTDRVLLRRAGAAARESLTESVRVEAAQESAVASRPPP
jgi:hypothetical protein